MLAAGALALLLLAPAAQGATAPRTPGRGPHVAVLSCLTAKARVATRLGCPTVPVGATPRDSGLAAVSALAASGSRTSLYAVGHRNSTLAQLSLGPDRALSFGACVTGDSFARACPGVPGASANAWAAPIARPTAAAVSPDGRSLYLVSGDFHAAVVARFARDPISGALAYQGCVTGNLEAGPSQPAACSPLPSATAKGFGSGLYEPSGIAIGADGRRVYVTAAGDGSVVAFDRDPASGALSLAGCVSSSRRVGGCARAPGRSILAGATSPFLSPDGRYLYAAGKGYGTVVAFRLGGTGALRFAGCVTSRDDRRPCRRGRRPEGAVAALSNPSGIAGTADGRFLYVSSTYGAIVALRRNRASGALTPVSCASSRREDRRRCARVPVARVPKGFSGTRKVPLLGGVRTPVLVARGRTLLAPVGRLSGLAEFRVNRRTGALAFRGCATGNRELSTSGHGPCQALRKATGNGIGSGFYLTFALAPAPGNLVYAASAGDSTVSLLRP
jgi:DNA-binding beta-propeller fold protein YncE